MEACNLLLLLHCNLPTTTTTTTRVSSPTNFTFSGGSSSPLLPRRFRRVRATSDGDSERRPVPRVTPPLTPSETVEIRFGPRKRRQQQQQQKKEGDGTKMKAEAAPKKWEDMTVSEKALELYVGEKGLLFWLNKLAYASIYAVIGGWILFRFVGPALNLYQLDSAPLSPTSIFKT